MLPTTRLAVLIAAQTRPEPYNTLREILTLLEGLKFIAGDGITITEVDGKIKITNLNP